METFQKRLKALSAKVKQEGIILDENQVAALEKATAEKQAQEEDLLCCWACILAKPTYFTTPFPRKTGLDTV